MKTDRAEKREAFNVAEAKRRFSDLLGRVAYGGETILITRRGKPMARLVPPAGAEREAHLAEVRGWLEEDDEFFDTIDEIVASRAAHRPRVLKPGSRRSRVPARRTGA